jgi:hypothetical protein
MSTDRPQVGQVIDRIQDRPPCAHDGCRAHVWMEQMCWWHANGHTPPAAVR